MLHHETPYNVRFSPCVAATILGLVSSCMFTVCSNHSTSGRRKRIIGMSDTENIRVYDWKRYHDYHARFRLDAGTGTLHRRTSRFKSRVGRPLSDKPSARGYRMVSGKQRGDAPEFQHRIIFMMVNGWLPVAGWDIHHMNGDSTDNRPSNLCAVRHVINSRGRRQRPRALPLGIRYRHDRPKRPWIAAIGIGMRSRTRSFRTFEMAHSQRQSWENELGYSNWHGRERKSA